MPDALRSLARSCGVHASFRDVDGRRRRASNETLVGVLRALGVEPDAALPDDRPAIEPVVVAWDGRPPVIVNDGDEKLECTLVTEDGDESSWLTAPDEDLHLPVVPIGYHTLRWNDGTTRIIAAPRRAPVPRERRWGVFLPHDALRTKRSWGTADLTDLEALAGWTASLGGSIVATLPLLAAFLDEPFDESPYAPVSRLFWNELYVDVEGTPEFASSPPARDLVGSPAFRAAIGAARGTELVDYREAYALKRRVLELLAETFFSSRRAGALDTFVREHPETTAYASFRASSGGASERMHLYAQLVADEQLARIAGLQLDVPIGVHPQGFDVQRFDVFASGAAAGAPPDAFFRGGQNWGCPPLHPVRSRENGHAYVIDAVRTLARRASVLRIDHVMGLHRQYWIPDGLPADAGAYVSYPAEELYAILTLEAHRNDVTLVGEDLGTVPRGVRPAMARHGVLRSYVQRFEDLDRPPPASALASLDTHDTSTFASDHPPGEVRESLERLAASPARIVIANLEDLWGEDRPQNAPGRSGDEHPNWQRKARLAFEEFRNDPEVTAALTSVDELRRDT